MSGYELDALPAQAIAVRQAVAVLGTAGVWVVAEHLTGATRTRSVHLILDTLAELSLVHAYGDQIAS